MENLPERSPLTPVEQIAKIELYLRNSALAFPNSVECLDMGLLFKSLEFALPPDSESNQSLGLALGAVHALCDVIDTNGPNGVREQYRNDALRYLAELRDHLRGRA